MAFSNIQPFPALMTPITNISPLTYRDAATFLDYLETIKQWLNEVLVPDSNAMIKNAIAEFQLGIANAEATINKAKDDWQANFVEFSEEFNAAYNNFKTDITAILANDRADIDGAKAEWQASFNAFMANVEAELAALNDASVGALIETEASATALAFKRQAEKTMRAILPTRNAQGLTNHTVMLETYLAELAVGHKTGELEVGIYYVERGLVIDSNAILNGREGGGTRRFGQEKFTYNPIVIRRLPGSTFTEPIVTLKGAGSGMRNVHIEGTGDPLQDLGPGLCAQGFETMIDCVRVLNVANIGADIQRANNTRWGNFYVDNCGTPTFDGVKVWSKNGVGHANETNTFDITGLTVESCENVHISIAYPPPGEEMNPEYYVELLRWGNVHVESSSRNARSGKNVGNIDAAVRIGNVRSMVLTAPIIFGGPGPVIEHKQTNNWKPFGMGGITLIAPWVLGSDVNSGTLPGQIAPTPYLYKLVSGNGFKVIAGENWRATTAIARIEAGYGPAAYFDYMNRSTIAILDDQRTFPTRHTINGKLAPFGPLRPNGKSSTISVTSAGVSNVSFRPGSNDARGIVTFDVTTPAIGRLIEFNFGQKLENSDPVLTLTAKDGASAKAMLHGGATNEKWNIYAAATPPPNTTYQIQYTVTE